MDLTETNTFLTSSLFYNDNIMIGRETVYIRQFYDKGIRFINDMINENEHFNFFSLTSFSTAYRNQCQLSTISRPDIITKKVHQTEKKLR